MRSTSYQYNLPQHLVATAPASPRDHSRLFVYDTHSDSIYFDLFINLHKHLPIQSLMVLNETRVVPSRIILYKKSEGIVVCLILLNEPVVEATVRIMVDRRVDVGECLYMDKTRSKPFLTILAHIEKGIFTAQLLITQEKLTHHLNMKGIMPIPPYLRMTPLGNSALKSKYQTTFAHKKTSLFSVAAPTASLHFTPRVFHNLDTKQIKKTHISLEVGLGTFAPLTVHQLQEGILHPEWYCIPQTTRQELKRVRDAKRPIISVGTTSVRALESYFVSKESQTDEHHSSTDMFIRPGFVFHYVDGLITNFHLPESSLMMLVEALLQHKRSKKSLIELYRCAIKEEFRFFSFGDAMLIL